MNNYIEIKKISCNNIFNNFSISFPMEKLIYLSGPNNSGKTTLIRILDRKVNSKYNIFIKNKELDKNNIIDYFNKIECLIPKDISFVKSTVKEEIEHYNKNLVDKNELIKKLKFTKLLNTSINKLDEKEQIKLQILISLLKKKKILLIDNIMSYFNKEEIKNLNEILKCYIKEYKTTIVITSVNLNDTINSDYLIILKNNEIILEGNPLDILENDNIINKAGLDLPFTIDLSSKLKDYDLIKEIELDKERLIDKLWK